MAFLLHLGYTGSKYPFFAQQVLIGLKKGIFLPKPAFLDSFLFHFKTYYATNSHFLAMESPWWSQNGYYSQKRSILSPKSTF
jgi:hypothetical protein